jgi:hypothetical protein
MAEFDTYGECRYGDGWYKGVRPEVEVPLNATRYILFMPDWRKAVSVEYEQMSSVTESDENKEYRVALMSRPLITEKVLISHNEFQARIENWLRLRHGTPFYCPLYVEPVEFSGNGSMVGQTTLSTTTDLSEYWYLNSHARFFFVLDRDEEVGQVAELSSVGPNQVLLSEQITESMTFERAVGFPAFTGLLKGERMKDITGTLTDFELTLQEIP